MKRGIIVTAVILLFSIVATNLNADVRIQESGVIFPDGGKQTWAWRSGIYNGVIYYNPGGLSGASVGINTTQPTQSLEIDKGDILVQGKGSFDATGEEAFVFLGDTNNYIKGKYGTGVVIGAYGAGDAVTIKNTSGNVGIGTSSPDQILHIVGANPRILLEASSANAEMNFMNSGDLSSEIWALYKNSNNNDFHFYQGGNKVTIQSATGNVGIGTAEPDEKLVVAGAATLYGNLQIRSSIDDSIIVEVGEGLDYAEGFHVTRKKDVIPGSVLIIDPVNPGKLVLSRKPYDTKVAGIVAGANGLGSGVRLGPGRFDHDVALAGRVYCNVDANYGEVKPGDLLTTSLTTGYAMKVDDFSRAQGAILGKAMQHLAKGQKGQILVLVTLQ